MTNLFALTFAVGAIFAHASILNTENNKKYKERQQLIYYNLDL